MNGNQYVWRTSQKNHQKNLVKVALQAIKTKTAELISDDEVANEYLLAAERSLTEAMVELSKLVKSLKIII